MLVKTLEEKENRAAQYICFDRLTTIWKRNYVVMENKEFKRTRLWIVVDKLLKKNSRGGRSIFTGNYGGKLDQNRRAKLIGWRQSGIFIYLF